MARPSATGSASGWRGATPLPGKGGRGLTVECTGKTDGEDWIDPELAAEYGRRILANIEEM